MYHINPVKGEPGACRALKGKCPFGGAEVHFETREAAETHFASTMEGQTLVAHRQFDTAPMESEAALKAAIESDSNVTDARDAWISEAVERAATREGHLYYQNLLAQAEPGSDAAVLYEHFVTEGNKLRISRLTSPELAEVLASARPVTGLMPVRKNELASLGEPPFDWSAYPDDTETEHNGWFGSFRQLKNGALDAKAFAADPDSFEVEDLTGLTSRIQILANQAMTMAPKVYEGSQLDWQELQKAQKRHYEKVMRAVLRHPAATAIHFEHAISTFGLHKFSEYDVPVEAVENVIAKANASNHKYYHIYGEAYAAYRPYREASNRVALYLAANDPNTEERLEALNQVIVTRWETLREEDRAWFVDNLKEMPTNDQTLKTLTDSLRMYAVNFADDFEKERILEVLDPPKTELAVAEKKRGWLRR